MAGPRVWRYSLPNVKGQGWAIVFMDDAGCFAALSDFGDWSYKWNPRGLPEGQDLRRFISSCDDNYLMGKLGGGRKEFDGERTLLNIRQRILGARRAGWNKQRAREEWALVGDYAADHEDGVTFDKPQFQAWQSDTALSDAWEMGVYAPPQQLRAFMAEVMPRLRAAIQADLDGEVHHPLPVPA